MRPISLAAIILPALASQLFGAAFSVLTIGSLSFSDPVVIDTGDGLFLNNLGEVAGTYIGPPGTGAVKHGFRTQPNSALSSVTDNIGQFVEPSDPNVPGFYSAVFGMNNTGQLIGTSFDGSGESPFLTDSSGRINAGTQKLGGVFPTFLNDRDQIAGTVNSGGTVIAFRTQPGQPYNAATDNLGTFTIRGLNNIGQILGNTNNGIAPDSSFLTPPDGPVVLGNLGSDFFGEVVNDLGQVAGIRGQGIFLTSPNQPSPNGTDFGTVNAVSVGVSAVNSHGVIVGTIAGDVVAFVGVDGQITNLDTLIDPSLGLHLTQSLRVNDNGQILALAHGTDGSDSLVLLTPIPEPASLALILLPAALLLRRRRSATSLPRG